MWLLTGVSKGVFQSWLCCYLGHKDVGWCQINTNVLLKGTTKSENDRHVIGKVASENCHEFQCRQSLKSENCMEIGRVL